MKLKDKESWDECVKNNTDPYGKCGVDVARRVMELLDDADPNKIDADKLIRKANKELDAGITGFLAGCIASIVSKCHVHGEQFRKSWNKCNGIDEDSEGVANPAIITLKPNV